MKNSECKHDLDIAPSSEEAHACIIIRVYRKLNRNGGEILWFWLKYSQNGTVQFSFGVTHPDNKDHQNVFVESRNLEIISRLQKCWNSDSGNPDNIYKLKSKND